jgi:hypothetical protein
MLKVFHGILFAGLVLSVTLRTSVMFLVRPDPTVTILGISCAMTLLQLLASAIAFRVTSHHDSRKNVLSQNPWRQRFLCVTIYIVTILGIFAYCVVKENADSQRFTLHDGFYLLLVCLNSLALFFLVKQELPLERQMKWKLAIFCYLLFLLAVLLAFVLRSDLKLMLSYWMQDSFIFWSTTICACIAGIEREPDDVAEEMIDVVVV